MPSPSRPVIARRWHALATRDLCPACSTQVRRNQNLVKIHGEAYHRKCAYLSAPDLLRDEQ
jgi:hypothetical protein